MMVEKSRAAQQSQTRAPTRTSTQNHHHHHRFLLPEETFSLHISKTRSQKALL